MGAMKLELEWWHVLLAVFNIVAAFWAIARVLMNQYSTRISEQFAAVTKQIEALAQQGAQYGGDVLRLERELAQLKLDTMRDFTRREDHNQAIASIRVGLDNMSLRIEKALSTGARLDG